MDGAISLINCLSNDKLSKSYEEDRQAEGEMEETTGREASDEY